MFIKILYVLLCVGKQVPTDIYVKQVKKAKRDRGRAKHISKSKDEQFVTVSLPSLNAEYRLGQKLNKLSNSLHTKTCNCFSQPSRLHYVIFTWGTRACVNMHWVVVDSVLTPALQVLQVQHACDAQKSSYQHPLSYKWST